MGSEQIQAFFMQADTVMRIVVSVCCLIVFADLSANGYHNVDFLGFTGKASVYNCKSEPLDYTFAIGLFGWLMATFLLAVTFFDAVSSSLVEYRSQLVIIDVGFNGLWAFFMFIAFCWTTNQFTAGNNTCFDIQGFQVKFKDLKDCNNNLANEVCFTSSNIQAAGTGIAFSFFCTILFGVLCFLGVRNMAHKDSADVSNDEEYLGAADPDAGYGVDEYAPTSAYAPMEGGPPYDYDE
mmetsp:Transcript_35340/g.92420  ORF Transcript_35340/g.92420 Transcript_35340/m.92420 type:complete len:237 (+) Transcript_35340:103-813(+)